MNTQQTKEKERTHTNGKQEAQVTEQDLIDGLNADLSGEWGAVIRYTYQSRKAFGLVGHEARELLEGEVQDEIGHASYLTDVIVDLGGEPTTQPKKFDKPDSLKAMLELDLEQELMDIENYSERIEQADQLGHVELKVRLEDIVADETGHARQLRRLLKGM